MRPLHANRAVSGIAACALLAVAVRSSGRGLRTATPPLRRSPPPRPRRRPPPRHPPTAPPSRQRRPPPHHLPPPPRPPRPSPPRLARTGSRCPWKNTGCPMGSGSSSRPTRPSRTWQSTSGTSHGAPAPGLTGIAHLVEHLSSSAHRHAPHGALMRILSDAGATQLNGQTTFDATEYYELVPPSSSSSRCGWRAIEWASSCRRSPGGAEQERVGVTTEIAPGITRAGKMPVSSSTPLPRPGLRRDPRRRPRLRRDLVWPRARGGDPLVVAAPTPRCPRSAKASTCAPTTSSAWSGRRAHRILARAATAPLAGAWGKTFRSRSGDEDLARW